MRVTDQLHDQKFFVRQPDPATGKLVIWATPLFLALVVINVADLIFAVDSVPAIFAITTDTFIVYTANIMAILGLRALYFALAAMVHRFHYLKYALALVLVFIGAKIFWNQIFGKVDPAISLGVTLALILAGILALENPAGRQERRLIRYPGVPASPTRPGGRNRNTNTYGSEASKLAGEAEATCIHGANASIGRIRPSSSKNPR
jgi:predicted tellurium resistance membrane protein TerC